MPLPKYDPAVRAQIKAMAARIIGYQPSDAIVDQIIDDINARPSYELPTERVISAIRKHGNLTEGQVKLARSSDIDRIVDEIEKKNKPR